MQWLGGFLEEVTFESKLEGGDAMTASGHAGKAEGGERGKQDSRVASLLERE